MNPLEVLSTAFSNAFRSKLRTTLTVLAIFVGAFTLTLTNGVGTGITRYIDSQVASMGATDVMMVGQESLRDGGMMGAQDSAPARYDPDKTVMAGSMSSQFEALSDADLEKIADVKGITGVEPLKMANPDYIAGPNGDMYELTVNPSPAGDSVALTAGHKFPRDEQDLHLLIPTSFVEPLGFARAEDAVGATVTLGVSDLMGGKHTVDAVVAGVQEETIMAFGMILSRGLTDALYEEQMTGLPTFLASAYPIAIAELAPDLSASDTRRIKDELAEAGYYGSTVEDQLGAINTVINGIVGVLNAFAVIALIAAGFGIINTLLMSVQERTREIGLMKAMGLSGGKVFGLFSTEAVVIGFLGSAIGALIAMILGISVSSYLAAGPLSDLPGLRVLDFDPLSVGVVILVVMFIAFLSGTLPALRAAKLNPIEALRYE